MPRRYTFQDMIYYFKLLAWLLHLFVKLSVRLPKAINLEDVKGKKEIRAELLKSNLCLVL